MLYEGNIFVDEKTNQEYRRQFGLDKQSVPEENIDKYRKLVKDVRYISNYKDQEEYTGSFYMLEHSREDIMERDAIRGLTIEELSFYMSCKHKGFEFFKVQYDSEMLTAKKSFMDASSSYNLIDTSRNIEQANLDIKEKGRKRLLESEKAHKEERKRAEAEILSIKQIELEKARETQFYLMERFNFPRYYDTPSSYTVATQRASEDLDKVSRLSYKFHTVVFYPQFPLTHRLFRQHLEVLCNKL